VDAPDPERSPPRQPKAEPVFSGGLFKVLGLLLVAAALGGGAYLLAGGGVGIDLPDLPETTTGEATTIEEGELSDTNLGEPPAEEPAPAPPAPSVEDAQRLNRCIADAGDDPNRIFACLEKF
jgi:hypothetical protein